AGDNPGQLASQARLAFRRCRRRRLQSLRHGDNIIIQQDASAVLNPPSIASSRAASDQLTYGSGRAQTMKARAAEETSGTWKSTAPLAAGDADAVDWPGRVFRQLTVLPTLLAMAWLLAGLPLLLIGHFTPLLMGLIAGPAAIALLFLGYRWNTGP